MQYRQSQRQPSDKTKKVGVAPGKSTLLLFAAFVVPPIVALASHIDLSQAKSIRTETRLRQARAASVILTVLLAISVTFVVTADGTFQTRSILDEVVVDG